MNDWSNAEKELQRLVKIGKLEWDTKLKKWNKKFYPETDDDNNFVKWKFGEWARDTCLYCGKKIETVQDIPKKRASKYCKIQHQKLHTNIVSRAKKKFDLKEYDPNTYDKKTWKNWVIMIPSIYQYFRDKTGQLHEKQIKDRVESKDISVHINGKRFPYTVKTRTI